MNKQNILNVIKVWEIYHGGYYESKSDSKYSACVISFFCVCEATSSAGFVLPSINLYKITDSSLPASRSREQLFSPEIKTYKSLRRSN